MLSFVMAPLDLYFCYEHVTNYMWNGWCMTTYSLECVLENSKEQLHIYAARYICACMVVVDLQDVWLPV